MRKTISKKNDIVRKSSAKDSPEFRLYGIFGFPLSHTLSPAMQEAAFSHLGIKAFYLDFEIKKPDFLELFKHLDEFSLDGFNITVPYKETVIPFLDRVSREARLLGAVNTVYRKNGKWIGENSDWKGFLTALKESGFRPNGKEAVVLGAGGAARAVVFALASAGIRRLIVVNRHPQKAERLIRSQRGYFPKTEWRFAGFGPEVMSWIREADLIVQTTSVGLKSGETVLQSGEIPSARQSGKKWFYDLIYNPEKTAFLKEAGRKGHYAVNGLGMLLHQGAVAFELWTGKKAPVIPMKKALERALRDRKKHA